jgi:hypothetical protein
LSEQVAAAFQAALERPQRTTESLGRLVPRQSFEVAQHQGLAILVWQILHFLIEDVEQLPARDVCQGIAAALKDDVPFVCGTARGGVFGLARQVIRYAVQPVGDGVVPVRRRCLASQD